MSERNIKCPDCEEKQIILPEDLEIGDILECENCAAEVEVQEIEPELKVELIIEEK